VAFYKVIIVKTLAAIEILRVNTSPEIERLLNRSLLNLEFAQGCSLVDFVGIQIF